MEITLLKERIKVLHGVLDLFLVQLLQRMKELQQSYIIQEKKPLLVEHSLDSIHA